MRFTRSRLDATQAGAAGPRPVAAIGRRIAAALAGLTAAAPALAIRPVAAKPAAGQRFVVYYGLEDDPGLDGCDLAVLEAEADARLLARRAPGARFLGYVSVGEIHAGRGWHAEAAAVPGLVLDTNPAWEGAHFVDLRVAAWTDLLLDRVVPDILARGFDGLFLDTIDDAEFLETRDPRGCAGMIEAAAQLVRRLRARVPSVPIMINRGYAVLPRIGGQFDMLLGESVRAAHDGTNGGYVMLSAQDTAWQRDRMWAARRRNPALGLYALDYWYPEDTAGIARLYAENCRDGFIPYVATRDLTRIVPAPGAMP